MRNTERGPRFCRSSFSSSVDLLLSGQNQSRRNFVEQLRIAANALDVARVLPAQQMLDLMQRVLPIFMCLACAIAGVAAKEPDREFLVGFLKGDYMVIGKKPDSDATYHGLVSLRPRQLEFDVTRVIADKTEHGTAWFETTGNPDHIPVLRMRFNQDGKSYEATYMWKSDLDNYGRITGYVFLPTQGATKSPGLEALFPLGGLTPPNP